MSSGMTQVERILFGEKAEPVDAADFRVAVCAARQTGRDAGRACARQWPAVRAGLHRHAHAARLGRARDHPAFVGRGSGRSGRHLLGALGLRLGRLHRAAGTFGQTAGAEEAFRTHRSTAVRERADAQVAGRASGATPGPVPRTHGGGPHHGAGSGQPPASSSRHARCADRSAQSRAARRSPGPDHRPCGTRQTAIRRAGTRSRSLQGHQRFARSSGR